MQPDSHRTPGYTSPFATVEPDVSIGDGVEILPGAYLAAGTVVGDGVRIGPNAVIGLPSDDRSDKPDPVRVREGAVIGANAFVAAGVTLGSGCTVQPGAVVSRSVPPRAIVGGNPAQIVGYVNSERRRANDTLTGVPAATWKESSVAGVSIHRLPLVRDMRGNLTVGEFASGLPFVPARYFIVFDVPSREVRGEHAHRRCEQFLMCIRGEISVVVDDGSQREEYRLSDPATGLYVPPMVWGIQYQHTDDAMLLVFASHSYDSDDYIRDYEQFTDEVRQMDVVR